jgi:hypothetical protein
MEKRSCRTAAGALLVCLLAAGNAPLCYGEAKRPWKKAWLASIAAVVAVNVLDARSSAGRYENNPLLQDARIRPVDPSFLS